jgi:hypothetical protein
MEVNWKSQWTFTITHRKSGSGLNCIARVLAFSGGAEQLFSARGPDGGCVQFHGT